MTIESLFCRGHVPLSGTYSDAIIADPAWSSPRIIVQFARRHLATRPRPRFPYLHREKPPPPCCAGKPFFAPGKSSRRCISRPCNSLETASVFYRQVISRMDGSTFSGNVRSSGPIHLSHCLSAELSRRNSFAINACQPDV